MRTTSPGPTTSRRAGTPTPWPASRTWTPADRSVSAYRFHDDDPIFFQKGLRLTCRNGDTEHGTKEGPAWGGPPATTFTTYAWVYQW